MAFNEVGKGEREGGEDNSYIKLAKIEIGDTVTGYLLRIFDSAAVAGGINLIMSIEGKQTLIASAGNVKWAAKDGKLKLGQNTRFTRRADSKVKGMKSTDFLIEQDAEDTVEVAANTSAPVEQTSQQRPPVTKSVADKIAAMKAGKGASS